MLSRWLPFEKPLVEIEEQMDELKRLAARENLDLSDQIARLEERKHHLMEQIFQELTPWEKVQMARHPKRPYTLDYIGALCSEWVELHGDRAYGDDGAIVAGFGRFNGRAVAIVGNQKGRDNRRRRLRRRDCTCGRQPSTHVGARLLLGHYTGRLRFHSLQRHFARSRFR